MAIPSSMTSGGLMPRRAGVRFAAYPSDPTFWTEVQCSSSTAFATSRTRFQKMAPSAGNLVVATFEVPYSTRSYAARARHYKVGYTTSPWTTVAKITPSYLVARMPDLGLYAHHVSQFGTLTTAKSKLVTLMFPDFMPLKTTMKWLLQSGAGLPAGLTGIFNPTSNNLLSLQRSVTVPPGVTLTSATIRVQRIGAASINTFNIRRVSNVGVAIAVVTLSPTTGGSGYRSFSGTVTSSAAGPEVASSAVGYIASVALQSTQGALTSRMSGFLSLNLRYTMPHIGAAY